MVAEVREEQSEKAQSPMLVTLSGMVMETKLEQPLKASEDILRVPSMMSREVFAGISPLYLYNTFPIYMTPSSLLLYQVVPSNAYLPIVITLSGIVMEVRELQ